MNKLLAKIYLGERNRSYFRHHNGDQTTSNATVAIVVGERCDYGTSLANLKRSCRDNESDRAWTRVNRISTTSSINQTISGHKRIVNRHYQNRLMHFDAGYLLGNALRPARHICLPVLRSLERHLFVLSTRRPPDGPLGSTFIIKFK